jgi:hypothetical protein
MTEDRLPGKYSPIHVRWIGEGDIIALPEKEPHMVVAKDRLAGGRIRLLSESLETRKKSRMTLEGNQKLMRLKVPRRHCDNGKLWTMALGDVVRYPEGVHGVDVVAVRQKNGWHTSAEARLLKPDVRVYQDLTAGLAQAVRNQHLRRTVSSRQAYRIGSVAATRDLEENEPTAWVRVERDCWRSTTHVEASDAMINFELKRRTYVMVYAPEEDAK